MNPTDFALVALGGAAGSVCRYLVSIVAGRLLGTGFPWGTLAVNVAGSFIMGAFIGLFALKLSGLPQLRPLVAVGFLGGFTTFSSFSLDAVFLWERGAAAQAAAYVLVSVVASLVALFTALGLVRSLS